MNKLITIKNGVIVAFVLLIGVVTFLIWKIISTDTTQSNTHSSSDILQAEDPIDNESEIKIESLKNAQIVEVGTDMVFSTIRARVNSVRTANTISDSSIYSQPEVAGEGAVFVIINMTQTNITSTPFLYSDFILIDDTGKNYSPYNAIGSIDNYMDVRELSPDIPESGNAVYRVPTSVQKLYIGGRIKGKSTDIYTELNIK